MSIKIRVSTCRKESTTKGNGEPSFGSYGAGASITFEMDPALLDNPEVFVGKVRQQYALCEGAMNDELARLKARSNGQQPTAAAAVPTAAAASPPAADPPAKRAAGRKPAEVAAEMKEYESQEERADDEDDDPPTSGKELLGWARNQQHDAKNWLIGLGKRLRYPNRILDWTPRQVDTAYRACRKEHRS